MGSTFAPTGYPFIPADADTRIARPVRGATMAGIADAANYLAGWRLLRKINHLLTAPVETYLQDDIQGSTSTWVRWHTGLLATHAWVAIEYLALDGTTGVAPHIDAVLQTPAGVVLDAGITWARDVGDLPTAYRDARQGAVGNSVNGLPNRVTSGTRPRPGAGAAMTRPRPIVLPGTSGTDVELHVQWEQARVYCVSIWEMHRELIT